MAIVFPHSGLKCSPCRTWVCCWWCNINHMTAYTMSVINILDMKVVELLSSWKKRYTESSGTRSQAWFLVADREREVENTNSKVFERLSKCIFVPFKGFGQSVLKVRNTIHWSFLYSKQFDYWVLNTANLKICRAYWGVETGAYKLYHKQRNGQYNVNSNVHLYTHVVFPWSCVCVCVCIC